MTDTTRQIVFGLLVPALITVVVIGPGRREVRGEAWRLPLALGAPVALTFLLLYGVPGEDWQYAMYLPVAGMAVGVTMAITPRPLAGRALLLAALGAGSVAAIWPVLERETIVWKLGPGLGVLALAAALEPLAARRPGATVPGGLTLAATAAAAIVLKSGFMKLTVPVAALVVALGVTTLVSMRRRGVSLADGGIAPVAPILVLAPIVAWLYSLSYDEALPWACYVLPAAAPLALWLGEWRPLRSRPPWLAVALTWFPVATIGALAVFLAFRAGEAGGSGGDPLEEMYRALEP